MRWERGTGYGVNRGQSYGHKNRCFELLLPKKAKIDRQSETIKTDM